MSQYTFPSDNVIGFQTNMSTYNEESDFVKLHEETIVENEISLDEESVDGSPSLNFESGDVDELYAKAVDIVVNQQKVSTSFIQRYLQIGYNRAARIVEKMEDDGIVSEANNAGKRQVLKKTN